MNPSRFMTRVLTVLCSLLIRACEPYMFRIVLVPDTHAGGMMAAAS
jgi:hypothetical protein